MFYSCSHHQIFKPESYMTCRPLLGSLLQLRFQNYIVIFISIKTFLRRADGENKAFPSTVLRREKKSARFCCCTPAALRSFDKMRGRAPKGLLCIKGCNFFSTRSFRVASTIVAPASHQQRTAGCRRKAATTPPARW